MDGLTSTARCFAYDKTKSGVRCERDKWPTRRLVLLTVASLLLPNGLTLWISRMYRSNNEPRSVSRASRFEIHDPLSIAASVCNAHCLAAVRVVNVRFSGEKFAFLMRTTNLPFLLTIVANCHSCVTADEDIAWKPYIARGLENGGEGGIFSAGCHDINKINTLVPLINTVVSFYFIILIFELSQWDSYFLRGVNTMLPFRSL